MKSFGKTYILEALSDWGAAGTRIIDVNVNRLISAFIIYVKITMGTASAMLSQLASTISKIELVDGSRVLFSVDGKRAQALFYYMTGMMPYNRINLQVSGISYLTIPVMFGRYIGDSMYNLDPTQYSNLQLKITWDEDAANTGVTTNAIEVVAVTIPPASAGARKGFFMTKDFRTYAMAASAHEYVDMPVDYPLISVLMQPYGGAHSPSALVDTFKVDINNNEEILYDESLERFLQYSVFPNFPLIAQSHDADNAITANTLHVDTSEKNNILFGYDGTAITAAGELANATYIGARINVDATVAIKKKTFVTQGFVPHHVVPIPFMGENMLPLWNINSNTKLRIDILTKDAADSSDLTTLTAVQMVA